ncbi:glycosyltransferase, partial [Aliarcobacter skirrowii]|uniref:glycosyltransferase n=1 Tax=Aliarcobacter skirrowii TaxID=28200 RepID=UPI0029A3DA7F
YNSSDYTNKLVDSIIKYSLDISYEIIVVDNNSEQEDLLKLREFITSKDSVTLVENSINSGFSGGNMLGINYAVGDYYFFINNDCELLNNAGKIFKDFLASNHNVGLCTGSIFDEKGNFTSSYGIFPHYIGKFFGKNAQRIISKIKFPSNKIKLNINTKVEVVSGSCMFFRAKDFCNIGGFDTVFFLYCEEEDISKRVWNSNKEVYFVPEAKITHKAGGSTHRNFEIEREFYISYYHLIEKHYDNLGQLLMKTALFFKLFFRIFKKKYGLKIFFVMLNGFPNKYSIRYKQKINLKGKNCQSLN